MCMCLSMRVCPCWPSSTGFQWSNGSNTRLAPWRSVTLTAHFHPTSHTNSRTIQHLAHSDHQLSYSSIHRRQISKQQETGHSDFRLPTFGTQFPFKFASHNRSLHSKRTLKPTSSSQFSIKLTNRQIGGMPRCPADQYDNYFP